MEGGGKRDGKERVYWREELTEKGKKIEWLLNTKKSYKIVLPELFSLPFCSPRKSSSSLLSFKYAATNFTMVAMFSTYLQPPFFSLLRSPPPLLSIHPLAVSKSF